MTASSHPARRRIGFLLLGSGLLSGLPLTASHAVRYVDVAPPARPTPPMPPARPLAAAAAVAAVPAMVGPVAPVAGLAAVAPAAAVYGSDRDITFIGRDTVRINGVTKRWEELTPAERTRIRRDTEKARADLAKQMRSLPQELANAERELQRFRNGDFQREIAEARINMRNALVQLDANAAHIRAAGNDPEKLKADMRRSLAEIEAMDVDKIVRENQIALNPDKIRGDVEEAARSLADIDAKLNRLDGR